MKKESTLKIVTAIAFLAMIFVNYLANALPLGGITTGEASDMYPNLFTPAGITFSIWGVIYLFLLGFTIYQFKTPKDKKRAQTLAKLRKLYLATSLANIAWIFAWHYQIIWLSVIIMITLLTLLIFIAELINTEKYSLKETVLVRIPFSIYFGWITVATIANITVFLVSINWDGLGISDDIWAVYVLLVGAAIGICRTVKNQNLYYGSVFVWAYAGILLKHTSSTGFSNAYPNIVSTVIICLILFITTMSAVGLSKIKE